LSRQAEASEPEDKRFVLVLGGILLIGLLLRIAYLVAQPESDPFFSRPAFDGAYYLGWARAIADGSSGHEGAFYLAPLYPHVLALLIKLGAGSFFVLYFLQHLLTLLTAAMIAILGRHLIGRQGSLAGAALFLLYHPVMFFASRPLGETLSIFLLFASLLLAARGTRLAFAGAGFVAGLAALSRPNLVLVPLLWAAREGSTRSWRKMALIICCTLLAILPVTLRNLALSGHPVLISSNGGLTAYHGNGPGARGVYTPAAGLSGEVASQREEATALARRMSGLELDDVEADGWWGRRALETRLSDPAGSLGLLTRRLALTIDSHEHGLDYAPALDRNFWRPFFFVPLALLLGLSGAGVVLRGFRGTGGWLTWSAILSCALAPLLFYVSSRYRVPAAALLVLPAGCGLAALLQRGMRKRVVACVVGAGLCTLSLLIPFQEMKRAVMGEGLSIRAVNYLEVGETEAALREAREAAEMAPGSALANYNVGVVENAAGFRKRAREAYRRSLNIDPTHVVAAANLGEILLSSGEFKEAIAILERALHARPAHEAGWNNLVLAYVGEGRPDLARDAVRRARRHGVILNPAMLQAFGIE
jgi:Tfp pilus assembly protein PilF